MTSPEIVIWLQERTALGILSPEVLDAIASVIEEQVVPAHHTLVTEGTPPEALYIIQQGQIESNSSNNNPALAVGFLPGAVINLQELLLDEVAGRTITTVRECHLLVVPAAKFREIAEQHPEIAQAVSRQMAQELAQLSSALTYEQERSVALRPYLVTKAQRGIVGTSRYAVRLREEIRKAAGERKSVLIFGEPGLEKDNIAALIHYGSAYRREPIIKINCGILQTSGADLFGRFGGKPGLLEWLGEGTLVLNNIQETPPELLPALAELIKTNTYTPVNRSGEANVESRVSKARILIISEKNQPQIERAVGHVIKVPPLRVRKADIKAQVEYYISLYTRSRGVAKPKVTAEALRRLQSYDFPGNIRELQNLVERAIVQAGEARELTEEIFWSAETKKKQFRVNLLNAYPSLRRFLRSDWWPDRINYGFTLTAFAFIIGVLFLGPQTRDRNFALNLFWAWWWPFFLLAFPFLGRVWCAVCPFMIYGEVTQKLSLWLFPRQLKGWPRHQAEKWGGWFLFGLFTLIFLWEELWNLENTAYLSACLLLLITAGAMIFSAIFERRFWCRYLCPIGGMNGLFAKLSMTELRAQQGICSASCTTYQCYKGGPQKGEGMETLGCPLYSHPAQLEDNRDCVLCMTCLKACPHRSVEFNLRPPGIELWTTHVAHTYEVALLFLLLGGVYLHRLSELQSWLGLNLDLTQFLPHLGLSLLALIVPAVISFAAYGLMRGFYWLSNKIQNPNRPAPLAKGGAKPRRFIELAYGYLPLVLGGNLAHYLRLGLGEGGRILPVAFATFGFSGEQLPVVVAHPAVIEFLQGSTLIFAVLLSMVLTQKIARQPMRSLLWQHLATIGLAASLWAIIVSS
ncbi:sigma 54-interacting transcriptional regulator [Iningainema tapete]|uniref:Sigma 54-interacting transcriptional regulator n=1 Tax=Iningainema tapete BLCC-T55 TaxID=2748662 RepID=A0A8J6XK84_9CYAN|nr:sigma 54-interacting transcriptional regulator [Iningainema tapete]MBD2773044.1 sigma 54-interacting transcriptional regulator [Iningainema tapete BLCC-T55]